MKFVIAPDSFKGCMTAKQAAEAIRTGLSRVFPDAEYVMVPMADGGEGTVRSLIDATGGQVRRARVLDPLQRPVFAEYGLLGNESASAPESHVGGADPGMAAVPDAAASTNADASANAAASTDTAAIAPTNPDPTAIVPTNPDPTAIVPTNPGPTAVIEMAAASGIQFVNEETRNPLVATTYGTGQLIRAALDDGARTIIIGIGGSATNDGGAGMAEALGVRFLDANGDPIPRGGGSLERLATIDASGIDPRIADTTIIVAADVTNPLVGPNGASAVFGPQKGATPRMVERLDADLAHYAAIINQTLGIDVAHTPGAGGAGGLGAGLLAFTGATMRSGVETVANAVHLADLARNADYCFTGEGGIDFQTQYGKTPMGVARAVRRSNPGIGVIALAGYVGEGIDRLYDLGIDAVFGIVPAATTLERALAEGSANLTRTAENVGRLLMLASRRRTRA
ncbi:glycerate kinase [Bifidobacterium margollesii]|uniref:Glycerate kinase n=1 Tax=Bifidobacterium margollesii TaxID=2020964 RepID=A0A2N5JCD4_9BIFI|nr:glycerate kinase [Bifidobacterium margollesii]PLS31860.1 glycerate kinase [Bifidobacterium margollesii]